MLENQSSSGSSDAPNMDKFEFPSVEKARYLRYVGHGSSSNDSNNIWKLIALMPGTH